MKVSIPAIPVGQTLLEAVLALAVFALLAATVVTMAVGGMDALQQGGAHTKAAALADEGVEALRSIRDRAWNKVPHGSGCPATTTVAVAVSGGSWVVTGIGPETIDRFTRTITLRDLYRDAGGNIVDCPGSYIDRHSIAAEVVVEWQPRPGVTNTVRRTTEFTNWDSAEWREDLTAEFSDGLFTNTATSDSLGDGDGAVVLQQQ